MTSRIRRFFHPFRSVGMGAALVLVIWFATAIASPAQTFTILHAFDGSDGTTPTELVQGIDGNFYGTTGYGGGSNCGWGYGGCGTVFKITPGGTLTTGHHFTGTDGSTAHRGLVQATDGSYYGITAYGGAIGGGTVFNITSTGKLTTLHNFGSLTDGYMPYGLMQASNGNFYGVTAYGGILGYGTVFKISPAGTLTPFHSFDNTDGATPTGQLVQGTDGNFYGTTYVGGAGGAGTVFKITPAGKLTTLYDFCSQANCTDGANPIAGLVQAADGNFYGTTYGGGAYGSGTVFKITPSGALTTLHSFCSEDGCTDGANPGYELVQGTDGNFYGTTNWGGAGGYGTLFEITPAGTLTTLHNFETVDGYINKFALLQGTDGKFYGSTEIGGPLGSGTIYILDNGLGPFVSFLRNTAKVGQTFGVLGQGLTGTSSVSFNGTPATFKVVKDTFLTAVVPAGATTVSVTVTTPGGVLTSNKAFRVTPQVLSFNPSSGPTGTVVTITGVSLTQATVVGFGNYVPASFTVNSDSQVTATVPTGAKTGVVGIQTAGGTGISSAAFTVTQ